LAGSDTLLILYRYEFGLGLGLAVSNFASSLHCLLTPEKLNYCHTGLIW